VPRFDSASSFGNLLDRGAGYFRFGPFGINVPTHRAYEPGTTVLVTTWHTPGGWVEIRDALTMAPRSGADDTTPPHATAVRRRRGAPLGPHGGLSVRVSGGRACL
jgi:GH15 family glucan-1,4-alpha-glucosidase